MALVHKNCGPNDELSISQPVLWVVHVHHPPGSSNVIIDAYGKEKEIHVILDNLNPARPATFVVVGNTQVDEADTRHQE
jgi:hypothetical protein